MKRITILLFLLGIVLSASTLSAQRVISPVAISLSTTPFSVALGEQSNPLLATTLGVNLHYAPIDRLSLLVGFEGMGVAQPNTSTYTRLSMLRLGMGYVFWNDTDRDTMWEMQLSAGNEMNRFGKFANVDLMGDVRFYLKKSFYMGVGVRQLHLTKIDLITYPADNTNLFFTFGYRFAW